MAGWGTTGTGDYTPEALLFTDRYYRPKFVDQLYNSNATLYMLRKGAKLISGGTSIEVPSLVANTGNFSFHTKAETYTASDVDQFDAARFEWKLAQQPVVIFEQDLLMNGDSKERRLSHVAARNMAAALEMGDGIGDALYDTDHTADSAIDSIDHAVDDAAGDGIGTNNFTYGAITRQTTGVHALWNSNIDDTTTTTSLGAIQTSYGSATEGSEHPNLGVTSQVGFNRLWVLYSPFQRIGTDLDGKLGFQSLNVNGQPVVVDSHVPRAAGANTTGAVGTGPDFFYWLNLNHLYMVAHKQAFFTFRASPMPVNQWVNIGHYHFMGNVVCDAPRYQAKMSALVA